MSNFPILDLVVGTISVYFLLSIITSSAVEMILTGLKARAALLEEWLFKIFDKIIAQPDGTKLNLGRAIMDQCSVTSLSPARKSTSYIEMPLTWKSGERSNADGKFSLLLLFSKITGLLAPILAIMMEAPFWFDLLNKVSNLRSTGAKPPASASKEERKKTIIKNNNLCHVNQLLKLPPPRTASWNLPPIPIRQNTANGMALTA